jgi:hypothetical protein
MISYALDPGVSLRSTPGFMLVPASQAEDALRAATRRMLQQIASYQNIDRVSALEIHCTTSTAIPDCRLPGSTIT